MSSTAWYVLNKKIMLIADFKFYYIILRAIAILKIM